MDPEELPAGRLGELLRAAAAPGRPHELAGEDAAVAGFRSAYRPVNRRRRRIVAIAVATFAAASVGGTAFAAGTGHLPGPVRAWLGEADRPSAAAPATTTTAAAPPPASVRGTPPASPGPSAAAAIVPEAACRAFLAFRDDPHARPVTADERRELARLAGGEPAIEDYCRRLLGAATDNPATANPRNGRKPSHPARPSHP
jgi:hypothetical protein